MPKLLKDVDRNKKPPAKNIATKNVAGSNQYMAKLLKDVDPNKKSPAKNIAAKNVASKRIVKSSKKKMTKAKRKLCNLFNEVVDGYQILLIL